MFDNNALIARAQRAYYALGKEMQGRCKGVASSKQALSRLMSKPRVSLEYGWSMARVWLEYAKCMLQSPFVRQERTLGPSGANSQYVGGVLHVVRYAAILLLMMVMGVNCVKADDLPFVLTTDQANPHYYLIQSGQFSSFYMRPYNTSNVSTSNVPSEDMLWFFMDAGEVSGTQYYYIIHKSGRYLYKKNDNDNGIQLNSSSSTDDSYKFYIEATDSYYFIRPKGGNYVNKKAGNVGFTNGLKNSTANDNNSQWKFIAYDDESGLEWTPPFTLSPNDDSRTYYRIKNIVNTSFYISRNTSTNMVNTSNVASEDMVWYFKEVPVSSSDFNGSDSYITYYYIIHRETGKYMCFNGDASEYAQNQDDAVFLQDKDNVNEERCQFVIVQAAKTTGNPNVIPVECYSIIPKQLKDYVWDKHSISLKDKNNGTNLYTKSDRTDADNYAHWFFESIDPCADPTISFDATTTKLSLASETSGSFIYYTTNGDNPTRSSTLFIPANGISLPENTTTIKAVAVKDGNARSEVLTKKVIRPTITLGSGTITYNGEPQTPTISSVMDGETPITNYVSSYDNNTIAGIGTVLVREGEGCNDYIYGTKDFTISPASLTVSAQAKSKTYGDDDPALTYTSDGLIGTDAITGSLSRAEGENTGTYAINQGTLTAGSNYTIAYTGANLTINAKELTVTAEAKSKGYGDDDPELTYTSDGLIGSDAIIGALNRTTGENVGSYPINLGTLTAGNNYNIAYTGANLTITAKSIGDGTIPASDITVDMSKVGENYTATVKRGETTLTENTDYTVSEPVTDENGIKTWTITGIGNYKDAVQVMHETITFWQTGETAESMKNVAPYVTEKANLSQPTNIAPYIVSGINMTKHILKLKPVSYIPKDIPVLLLTGTLSEAAETETDFTSSPKNVENAEDTSNNLLKISEGQHVETGQVYAFYKGRFALTSSGTLKVGKFYLDNPNYQATSSGGSTDAAPLRIVLEDMTGIDIMLSDEYVDTQNIWYSVDGRRLNGKPAKKGLYINNGRKVVIK